MDVNALKTCFRRLRYRARVLAWCLDQAFTPVTLKTTPRRHGAGAHAPLRWPLSQATDDLHHKRQELEQLVGRSERAGLRRGVIIALLLAAAGGGAWWWTQQQQRAQREPDALQWEKAVVDRGDMVMTATATGNLRPKSQVDIGAEVSGRIASVEVTFNDRVKAGQVLARFDTELLDQALDQARRAMAVDQAGLKRAQANLAEARANQARVKALAARGAAAASELDAVLAQVQRAQAEVESAQAQIRVAQLRVAQAQTNLSRAIITSPIDGVVLQRNVEPGNTVAASLQSPNLFILAQDLRKMELHVAVDEADVGMVQADQQATSKQIEQVMSQGSIAELEM